MKTYRVITLLGLLAVTAASIVQAQDFDDIYYDASSSKTEKAKKVKVVTPTKTLEVYGQVPEVYTQAVQGNYSVDRDVDEYNRRGEYDPEYALSLDGDTIYEEAFANTRRIERFYNPDVVILSDDEDLVELYYDESPTVNLIIGSDWGYASYGWPSSFYWYDPWYYGSFGWYNPWWRFGWHSAWHYGWYSPWYYGWHGPHMWGWDYWGYRPWWHGHYGWDNWTAGNWNPRPTGRPTGSHFGSQGIGRRTGLAQNRNGRTRTGLDMGGGRNGIPSRGDKGTGIGTTGSRGGRGGYATGRSGGNMGSRSNSGVGVSSRAPSSTSRSNGSSVYGGSRSSSSGSYSGGSRSSGSYSGGSRSSGSYSGGSRSSGGSYSGGSSGSSSRGSSGGGGGGGSRGGSSGGGGHRR